MRIVIGCVLVMLLAGCGGTTATDVPALTTIPLPYPTGTAMATPFRVATPILPASTPTPMPIAVTILVTPTTASAQVVTVQGSDRVNVRASAAPTAAVIALFGAGADLLVIGPDTMGTDGMRWVHVQAGDRDGYIRSDLVSGPHASAGALPTPVFLATRAATLPAPMLTPSPLSAVPGTPSPITATATAAAIQIQTAAPMSVPTATPGPKATLAAAPKPSMAPTQVSLTTAGAGMPLLVEGKRGDQITGADWVMLRPESKLAYVTVLMGTTTDAGCTVTPAENVAAIDQNAATEGGQVVRVTEMLAGLLVLEKCTRTQ